MSQPNNTQSEHSVIPDWSALVSQSITPEHFPDGVNSYAAIASRPPPPAAPEQPAASAKARKANSARKMQKQLKTDQDVYWAETKPKTREDRDRRDRDQAAANPTHGRKQDPSGDQWEVVHRKPTGVGRSIASGYARPGASSANINRDEESDSYIRIEKLPEPLPRGNIILNDRSQAFRQPTSRKSVPKIFAPLSNGLMYVSVEGALQIVHRPPPPGAENVRQKRAQPTLSESRQMAIKRCHHRYSNIDIDSIGNLEAAIQALRRSQADNRTLSAKLDDARELATVINDKNLQNNTAIRQLRKEQEEDNEKLNQRTLKAQAAEARADRMEAMASEAVLEALRLRDRTTELAKYHCIRYQQRDLLGDEAVKLVREALAACANTIAAAIGDDPRDRLFAELWDPRWAALLECEQFNAKLETKIEDFATFYDLDPENLANVRPQPDWEEERQRASERRGTYVKKLQLASRYAPELIAEGVRMVRENDYVAIYETGRLAAQTSDNSSFQQAMGFARAIRCMGILDWKAPPEPDANAPAAAHQAYQQLLSAFNNTAAERTLAQSEAKNIMEQQGAAYVEYLGPYFEHMARFSVLKHPLAGIVDLNASRAFEPNKQHPLTFVHPVYGVKVKPHLCNTFSFYAGIHARHRQLVQDGKIPAMKDIPTECPHDDIQSYLESEYGPSREFPPRPDGKTYDIVSGDFRREIQFIAKDDPEDEEGYPLPKLFNSVPKSPLDDWTKGPGTEAWKRVRALADKDPVQPLSAMQQVQAQVAKKRRGTTRR